MRNGHSESSHWPSQSGADFAAVTALTCLLSLSCLLLGSALIGCAVLDLDLALERESWTGLHPSAHWLPGIPPSGLAGGRCAPHCAGPGGPFGEWGAQRGEALTLPAAMGELREGLLEGHLSCVLMDLRITGQWRVTMWGLGWAASSAWQAFRQGPGNTGQGGLSGSAVQRQPGRLVWQASSLGVPVRRQ